MTGTIKLRLVVSVPSGNTVMDITLQTGRRSAGRPRAGQGQPLAHSTAHPSPVAQPGPPCKWVCRGCTGIQAEAPQCSCHAMLEGSPGKSWEVPVAGTTPHFNKLSHSAAGRQRQGGRRSPPFSPQRNHHCPGRAWAWPQ